MAAVSPFLRYGVALGVNVAVVALVDRRQDASGDAKEWAFQREVEAVLYSYTCAHAYRDDFAVNKLFTVRLATLQCVELHGTVLYYHPTCYTKQKQR